VPEKIPGKLPKKALNSALPGNKLPLMGKYFRISRGNVLLDDLFCGFHAKASVAICESL
jgi:hypothetical protein